jgi:cellulose biosynthesis protein BcsQ
VTTILIGNHKGGVGKTTFTTAMADELARQGRKVIAIDLDPQANLTRRMGYQPEDLADRPTIATALAVRTPAAFLQCLVPCQWEMDYAEQIWLAPGDVMLEERALEAGQVGAWRRMRALLETLDPTTVVLIDTQPSMGHLVQMGLTAADHVVAVTHAEYDSVRGTYKLRDFIEAARSDLDLRCTLAGVVVNSLRRGVAVHTYRTDELRASFGDLLWSPEIPLRAAVAESQEHALPPQADDPRMREAFAALGARVAALTGGVVAA